MTRDELAYALYCAATDDTLPLTDAEREDAAVSIIRRIRCQAGMRSQLAAACEPDVRYLMHELNVDLYTAFRVARFRLCREQRQAREEREQPARRTAKTVRIGHAFRVLVSIA